MADAAEEKRSRFDDVPMEEEEAKASLLKEIESPSDDSDSKSVRNRTLFLVLGFDFVR